VFELIPQTSYTIEHSEGGVLQGKLTAKPEWNSNYSRVGSIAIQAESVASLLRHVQTHMTTPKNSGESEKHVSKGDKFYYFQTYDECLEVFTKRPNEIRVFEEKLTSLQSPDNQGNDIYYDVTGDFVDVGKYLEGVPETYGNMYMGNPRAFFATIMVNLSATCYFDQRALQARSKRILRLVDWLEGQQIRTKILAFHSTQCEYVECVVKRYQDSFSLDDLAIISSPDFLRRVLFRISEWSDTWEYGYGTSTILREGRLNSVPRGDSSQIMILSETDSSIPNTEKRFDTAEQLIEQKLFDNDVPISIET